MVGLSVVLEGQDSHLDTASNGSTHTHGQQPQLVNNNNKAPMVIHQTDIPSSSLIPYSPKNYNPPAPTASPSLFPAWRETELPYSSTFRLPPVFLDCCCFCKAKLMPGRDIYMYKGDGGFCSVECRCRQISLDEQADVIMKKKNKKKKKKHCKTC